MRWSEIETLKFVKLYLRHENLWNTSDVDYKMKNKRQKAYNEIISEFRISTGISMSETDLKVKIKNLRSTYTQEVSKIRQRSSPNFVYTPTIKWFAEWHSCFSAAKKRMRSMDDDNTNNEKMNGHGDKQVDSFSSQSDDYLIIVKPEPVDYSSKGYRLDTGRRIKKRKRNKQVMKIDLSEKRQDNNICSNPEDEFDMYGKHLATQLRSMDLYRALRVQVEIQRIVSEARISILTGT